MQQSESVRNGSPRQRLSLELSPNEPYRIAQSKEQQMKSCDCGDPKCLSTTPEDVCPSHACLVTTAVALAWSESLMKMHLFIMMHG